MLFHIRADRSDLTFELSRQIMAAIGRWVTVEDHVTGFRYFDARDLLGFVDGTENPTGRGRRRGRADRRRPIQISSTAAT